MDLPSARRTSDLSKFTTAWDIILFVWVTFGAYANCHTDMNGRLSTVRLWGSVLISNVSKIVELVYTVYFTAWRIAISTAAKMTGIMISATVPIFFRNCNRKFFHRRRVSWLKIRAIFGVWRNKYFRTVETTISYQYYTLSCTKSWLTSLAIHAMILLYKNMYPECPW